MNLPPPKSRRLRPPRGRAPAAAGPVRAAEAEVRRAAGVRGEHDGAGCVVVPGRRGVPDVRRAARHRVPLRGGGGTLQGAAAMPHPRVTSAFAPQAIGSLDCDIGLARLIAQLRVISRHYLLLSNE